MDGSRNMTIDFKNKRYHILYVGVHGGSGIGANDPYNGRYYLVSPDLWKKEKENYCMVHDAVLKIPARIAPSFQQMGTVIPENWYR